MNIRKYIRDVISENYPLGAANDPNAPWNDNTKYSTPEEPENSVFDVIAMNRDMAILKDSSGKKYFFYYEHLDRSELSDYAEREVVDAYRDEDGDMSIDYSDDWEIDENVIDRYVNDNISSLKVGKGFDDYESGNFDVIEIDGPLKQELIRMYGTPDKYTNEREAAIIQKSLEGIGGGETTDLSEGVKDKEPFGKVIFGVDLSTVGESERVHLIQLIKKYKGEGIKTDTSGSWATYVPIDDVEDFVSDARKFKPSSTGETEQFSKFKNRTKELKIGDKIKFFDYEVSETNPPIETGLVKIIKPLKVLIDYPGSPKGEWISLDKIDKDFFYHKDLGDVANKYTKVYFLADFNEVTQDEKAELLQLIKKFGGITRHLRGAGKASGGQEYALLPADKFEEFYQEAEKFEPYEGEMEKDVVSEEEIVCEIRKILRKLIEEKNSK